MFVCEDITLFLLSLSSSSRTRECTEKFKVPGKGVCDVVRRWTHWRVLLRCRRHMHDPRHVLL
jgi:hypothetical protein